MDRTAQINLWLETQFPQQSFDITPASADASFRRYFRVARHGNPHTLIVMDAPPEQEDCGPWLKVASLLQEAGVRVPEILAQDTQRGFLLLSDLGTTTYLDVLTADNAQTLYIEALGTLLAMQRHSRPGVLPDYSRDMLLNEMRLFPQWYIGRHKGIDLDEQHYAELENLFSLIAGVNLAEPRVFVHRDYHSRNLMHQPGTDTPGVIDFQDAVYGPLSYDLASLFKDAYIRWEEEFVLDLLIRYWEMARRMGLPVRDDFADFHRDYEWMGVQRHLKILGIFSRLYYRDGKDGYLKDLPLVMDYLRRACRRYRELAPLLRLLNRLEPEEVSVGYTF